MALPVALKVAEPQALGETLCERLPLAQALWLGEALGEWLPLALKVGLPEVAEGVEEAHAQGEGLSVRVVQGLGLRVPLTESDGVGDSVLCCDCCDVSVSSERSKAARQRAEAAPAQRLLCSA